MANHPLHLEGSFDPPLSRWQPLVKWLLVIPHAIVLTFLWIAYIVLSIGALAAIVATGRYPRAIFDFNVGVMRWTWRVGFYSYSALGTDRYPPFTLVDVPDYPARLAVAYPESLSRGHALVKWLLAFPHYLIVAALASLRSVLMLIAGAALLFSGRYPEPLFELTMAIERWLYRVAVYASLMTDEYPPFSLDAYEPEVVTMAA